MSAPLLVIAIDGPAAAGKGTLARRLAEKLEINYLDTGLLYRAVARKALDDGVDIAHMSAESQAQSLSESDIKRADLRTPEVDQAASIVARQAEVRQALMSYQKKFASQKGGVIDGRDIGTVICPEAPLKLFVTASPYTRAYRRWLQNGGKEGDVNQKEEIRSIQERIEQRDKADRERPQAPLQKADDAILIETDSLTEDEVLGKVLSILAQKKLI